MQKEAPLAPPGRPRTAPRRPSSNSTSLARPISASTRSREGKVVLVNGRPMVQHALSAKEEAMVKVTAVQSRQFVNPRHLNAGGDPAADVAQLIRDSFWSGVAKHQAAVEKAERDAKPKKVTPKVSAFREAQEQRMLTRRQPKPPPRNYHREKNEPALLSMMTKQLLGQSQFGHSTSTKASPRAPTAPQSMHVTPQLGCSTAPSAADRGASSPTAKAAKEAVSSARSAMHRLVRLQETSNKAILAASQSLGDGALQVAFDEDRDFDSLSDYSETGDGVVGEVGEDLLESTLQEGEAGRSPRSAAASDAKRLSASLASNRSDGSKGGRNRNRGSALHGEVIDGNLHIRLNRKLENMRQDERKMKVHQRFVTKERQRRAQIHKERWEHVQPACVCDGVSHRPWAVVRPDSKATIARAHTAQCFYTPRRQPAPAEEEAVKAEIALAKKEQIEMDFKEKATAEADDWQRRVDFLELQKNPESIFARRWWLAAMVAFVAVPAAVSKVRDFARGQLRLEKKDTLVQTFRQNMMVVVWRLRRKHIGRARAALKMAARLIMLRRRAAKRKHATAIVMASLRRAMRRKPTMYFLHRYHHRIKQCQNFFREHAAARRAHLCWALILFHHIETRDKGARLTDEAEYPGKIIGKSQEWMGSRCAEVAHKHFPVPLEIKLPHLKELVREHGEEIRRSSVAYFEQQRRIRALSIQLDGNWVGARSAVYAKDGHRVKRPNKLIIPAESAIRAIYQKCKVQHLQQCTETFHRRRKHHQFLKMPNFCIAYNAGLKQERQASELAEREVITIKGAWIDRITPCMDRRVQVSPMTVAVKFYGATYPPIEPPVVSAPRASRPTLTMIEPDGPSPSSSMKEDRTPKRNYQKR